MDGTDLRSIRTELGLSQTELAALVGFSVRTIQSCEQGWRKPSPALEKMVLLLYMAEMQGEDFGAVPCWEAIPCPPERRDQCVAYRTRQGHLCWFLTGTLCHGQRLLDWREKRSACMTCEFFHHLMTRARKSE
jgi:DNA-binding XRE family transcriptional regulator